jgi:hypothetical protein
MKQPNTKARLHPGHTVQDMAASIIERLFKRYGLDSKAKTRKVIDIAFIMKDPVTVAIVTVESGKRPYTGSAVRNPSDANVIEAGAALALRRALLDAMRSLKLLKKHAA